MSEDVFVLVCAGRSYKAKARLVFRDLGKQFSLSDNVINKIHERYMDLVHLDENARSTIHAALQRAWVQKTLRVPITFGMEEVLLQDKRMAEQDTRNAAHASSNAAASSRNVVEATMNVVRTRAHFLDVRIYAPEAVEWAAIHGNTDNEERAALPQTALDQIFLDAPIAPGKELPQMLLDAEERLAQAIQRAARDAAVDKFLAYDEAKRAASNAVRATEIARIGHMMKMPHWVKVVVEFS